jgi:hypothetical protein
MKEDQMGEACGTDGVEEKYITGFGWENLKKLTTW